VHVKQASIRQRRASRGNLGRHARGGKRGLFPPERSHHLVRRLLGHRRVHLGDALGDRRPSSHMVSPHGCFQDRRLPSRGSLVSVRTLPGPYQAARKFWKLPAPTTGWPFPAFCLTDSTWRVSEGDSSAIIRARVPSCTTSWARLLGSAATWSNAEHGLASRHRAPGPADPRRGSPTALAAPGEKLL
jgi:hypothetical protein